MYKMVIAGVLCALAVVTTSYANDQRIVHGENIVLGSESSDDEVSDHENGPYFVKSYTLDTYDPQIIAQYFVNWTDCGSLRIEIASSGAAGRMSVGDVFVAAQNKIELKRARAAAREGEIYCRGEHIIIESIQSCDETAMNTVKEAAQSIADAGAMNSLSADKAFRDVLMGFYNHVVITLGRLELVFVKRRKDCDAVRAWMQEHDISLDGITTEEYPTLQSRATNTAHDACTAIETLRR